VSRVAWSSLSAPGTLAMDMPKHSLFPVIDVFAGPGGLAEGFTAFRDVAGGAFDVRLSVEKDDIACSTLRLRKFVRAFGAEPPADYFAFLRGDLKLHELYAAYRDEHAIAEAATCHAELGTPDDTRVLARVKKAVGRGERPWVLLGGPPCQAYSIVGRSRMRTTKPDFAKDKRHTLYREYLRIVAAHRPAVFVMENVRGILSSEFEGGRIIEQILRDLRHPGVALDMRDAGKLKYRLYGLGPGSGGEFRIGDTDYERFLLRSEEYGVPQARQRVFIVGVRADVPAAPEPLNRAEHECGVRLILRSLPKLRSRLSRTPDSPEKWESALRELKDRDWAKLRGDSEQAKVAAKLRRALDSLQSGLPTSAGNQSVTAMRGHVGAAASWFNSRPATVTLHESRRHMKEDLHRYFYAACYAAVTGRSPLLKDFPKDLHPRHTNVKRGVKGEMFADRFHVQVARWPSSTVTSHMAKDGHYFIHYDPRQCRSLTVREAARLQTFPDDYYFCGNRTEQYQQVGNAVPPLLSYQVASRVYELLRTSKLKP
jgi:DNA (cytosine-5)-methyltransferase 1